MYVDKQKVHLDVPVDLLSDVRQEMTRYQGTQSGTIFALLREAIDARRDTRDYVAWARYKAVEQGKYIKVPASPVDVHVKVPVLEEDVHE